MVSDLLFYQLGLLGLLWLCIMLHMAWPSDHQAVTFHIEQRGFRHIQWRKHLVRPSQSPSSLVRLPRRHA
jgi:hypothetical protein